MNALKHKSTLLLAIATAISFTAATAMADPLPGRDLLKFSQKPMVQTGIFGQVYEGHDEFSTAYRPATTVLPPLPYRGVFMADDFADTLTTPVVHVKWWGSYLNHSDNFGHIQKFLIAFEDDVAVNDPNNVKGFSYPDPAGQIHSQIVTLTTNPLTPQSGLFTEKLINGGTVGMMEDLYEYNAELAIPFPQQADTVHWLKIVALVDHNPAINAPEAPGAPVPQWGWHNRDYTQQNPSLYVAGPPQVSPGENQQGNAALFPIWHFQDDAVSGRLDVNMAIDPNGVEVIGSVDQHLPTFNDEYYIDNIDGPGNLLPGFQGISAYSKDLAFELYTTQIPEPASLALMAAGFAGVVAIRRRRRG